MHFELPHVGVALLGVVGRVRLVTLVEAVGFVHDVEVLLEKALLENLVDLLHLLFFSKLLGRACWLGVLVKKGAGRLLLTGSGRRWLHIGGGLEGVCGAVHLLNRHLVHAEARRLALTTYFLGIAICDVISKHTRRLGGGVLGAVLGLALAQREGL